MQFTTTGQKRPFPYRVHPRGQHYACPSEVTADSWDLLGFETSSFPCSLYPSHSGWLKHFLVLHKEHRTAANQSFDSRTQMMDHCESEVHRDTEECHWSFLKSNKN